MTRWIIAVTLLVLLVPIASAQTNPSVVVIGIDGMDPQILQRFMNRGLMPNFTALAEEGSFQVLGTSIPPQSPVAWSNFITGMDAGGHGIFDFIHRDPATYQPVFSSAVVTDPEKTVSVGDWIFPLSKGETRLLRKGEAFWQILETAGIPYNVFRVPANFPPAPGKGKSLSGMGTPDILGGYGTFSYYTDDDLYDGIDIAGGELHRVEIVDGHFDSKIVGPINTLHRDRPELIRSFTVDIDPDEDVALFTVGNDRFLIGEGEWSDWVRVKFDLMGPLKGITGICRFYLRSVRPYFHLYMTPVNIDPSSPALPISTPDDYASAVQQRIGYYYTQGMPEDTGALANGMLSDAEFVSQTDNVMEERWKMLDTVLDEYQSGFLFFYVSTVDQSCHALWRNADPGHPAHTAELEFGDRFEYLYAQMDSLVGVVRERIPEDATIMVMSDHGFAPYYHKVNLNTWLYENDYLALVDPEAMGRHVLFENVFWRRTKAYAIGINGLYVNQLNREARGIVRAGSQYDQLLDEISAKLLAWRDPDTGGAVITRVYKGSDVYHGPEAIDGPDLVIGYNRGYRGSDECALGTVSRRTIMPNVGTWTGDHCMDHTLVPGILLSNRSIATADPQLIDLPVTILNLYGVPRPGQMTGRALLDN